MENLVAIILIVTQHFQLLTLVVARQRGERAMVVASYGLVLPKLPIGDVAMIEIVVSHSSYEMHSCRLYDRRVENEHNPL